MKTTLTIDSSRPARAAVTACTASIDTTILKTLSLNAPRNWVHRNG